MFDLEAKILEWRKQMLSAGIKSPVPLDELECHLRERIDSLKAGLSEADAFQTAAKELGDGKVLKKEFSKGKLIWRVRTNPAALNILGAWFILGGMNSLLILAKLWRVDFLQDDWAGRYWVSAILALFGFQLVVGIGLLYRGKFWRHVALVFCGLRIILAIWDVSSKIVGPPGWDSPGHYFILMGVPIPMRFQLSVDFLNLCLLLWAIYILTRSSMTNLFRPEAAN